jgi:hypothetical protein
MGTTLPSMQEKSDAIERPNRKMRRAVAKTYRSNPGAEVVGLELPREDMTRDTKRREGGKTGRFFPSGT